MWLVQKIFGIDGRALETLTDIKEIRLQNACKTPTECPRSAGKDPRFCFVCFWCAQGASTLWSGVGCDGVALPTPWLRRLRLLNAVDACMWLPTLRDLRAMPASNGEICERRDLRALTTPRNAKACEQRQGTPSNAEPAKRREL